MVWNLCSRWNETSVEINKAQKVLNFRFVRGAGEILDCLCLFFGVVLSQTNSLCDPKIKLQGRRSHISLGLSVSHF